MSPDAHPLGAMPYNGYNEKSLFSIEDVWQRYLRSMDAVEACRQHLQSIESYLLVLTICQIILIVVALLLLLVSIRFCQTCRRLLTVVCNQSISSTRPGSAGTTAVTGCTQLAANVASMTGAGATVIPDNNGDVRRKYTSQSWGATKPFLTSRTMSSTKAGSHHQPQQQQPCASTTSSATSAATVVPQSAYDTTARVMNRRKITAATTMRATSRSSTGDLMHNNDNDEIESIGALSPGTDGGDLELQSTPHRDFG